MENHGNNIANLEARNSAMRQTMDSLLSTFRQKQEEIREVQEQAAQANAEVTSRDGLVTVRVGSTGTVEQIVLAPTAFSRSTPEKLSRTLTEVIQQAGDQVRQQVSDLFAPLHRGVPDLPDLVEGAPSLRTPGTLPEPPPERAERAEGGPAPSPSTSRGGVPPNVGGAPLTSRGRPEDDDEDDTGGSVMRGGRW
ncbi:MULTISPECIES: YbaB/EbfC family nucleoid-associated protein [Actinoalloteichus]|uniref:Conserved DNA-binding protein YbaB n=1 Tax=Actinoalloteichus caeruleus DSM 43889 TaxID=1120930 RepID=A0ABT1JHV5_ACTCY|nr:MULTISPECIES: YbaB/EbfC family nucleoid-associated protein [Actinoalloteichus]MCP2332106.1 Conserved DNA-binding protein YbaB [Actinoalloteichus caeruleus DSM 43889]